MKFERILTLSPDNENIWERRDARIFGKDGVNFEQKCIEVPKFWSDNALNIVASKYFKIINGVLENSVRDLIARVVNTIVNWGKLSNYFSSIQDEEIFHDELTYLLTYQYASFNSPIWFNFGVPGREQQAAACFLIGLEDNSESIRDWVSIESKIFKGGSGSGVNLSPLRSKNSPLRSGGVSSGPISFNKGADCNAGIWKSGGTTRRAARFCGMDISHPDIEEFITCKIKEERKAKALIAAGYDPSIDGDAYTTVAFQNMNHSIRVSDEFMRSIIEQPTNKENERLLRLAAQCAWESGDPGIQYDTIINSWNTIPNSGKITTSNPSMPAGILVHTDTGIFPIETLENKVFKVRQLDGDWKEAKCFLSGKNKEIFKIKFRSGVEIYATAEHKWPVLHKTFYKGKIKHTQILKAKTCELSQYDRIPTNLNLPLDFNNDFKGQEDEGFLLGYLTGDGWFSIRTKGEQKGNKVLGFVFNKDEKYLAEDIAKLCNRFSGYSDNKIGMTIKDNCWYIQPSNKILVSFIESFGIIAGKGKRLPVTIWQSNDNFIRGYIDGLLSADGTVDIPSRSIRLYTSREELADDLIKLFSFYGIKCNKYGGKPHKHGKWPNGKIYDRTYVSWYVSIDSSQINKFAEFFSFSHVKKQQQLESLLEITRKLDSIDSNYQIVESIELAGNADVWDISVFGGQNVFPVQYCYTGNCGEYLSTDWSSCLLASFNLVKFYEHTFGFNYNQFSQAIKIFTTALDIIIDHADYPDPKFKETAHKQRQIGLGYSNLGALLMIAGYPYNSEEGRDFAARITSFMTASSYLQSADLAEELGSFEDLKKNRMDMIIVIEKHIKASRLKWGETSEEHILWNAVWNRGMKVGFRNATTTLIAPTGTISFMMDCDTTGIEPKVALVSYKNLVGGGLLKLVTPSVQQSLINLGYYPDDIEYILDWIESNDTIEDAKYLKSIHLPIFDCALKPSNGSRVIDYMGHVKMLAAIQPFLSMGISKTVNMPNDATVDDIFRLYIDSWKLDIKSLAVYRDGSKSSQPLNVKNKTLIEDEFIPTRKSLPPERPSITHKFDLGGFEGYLHVGIDDNGDPKELFIQGSKQGSTISGLLDSFAISVSYCLQYGVPLNLLVEKFTNTRFEPAGFARHPDIKMATSIVDYIFRWMEWKFISKTTTEARKETSQLNGNLCRCGGILISTGTCHTCPNCGTVSGGCG